MFQTNIKLHKNKYLALLATGLILFFLGYRVAEVVEVTIYNVVNSSSTLNWGLGFGEPGEVPTGTHTYEELREYNAYYCADTDEKIIYLTFDAGFENGNTEAILDALIKNDVKATFFLVGNYIDTAPELVSRMIDDGHEVANHSYYHPDMTQKSKEDFEEELFKMEECFRELTGKEIGMYYRPPQGKYNESNLLWANNLGYKTVFWSLAYVDWYENDQPSHEEALKKLTERIHPGAVVLLHNTSKTNGEILDELMNRWQDMGYTFGTLDQL